MTHSSAGCTADALDGALSAHDMRRFVMKRSQRRPTYCKLEIDVRLDCRVLGCTDDNVISQQVVTRLTVESDIVLLDRQQSGVATGFVKLLTHLQLNLSQHCTADASPRRARSSTAAPDTGTRGSEC
jgi:hypothetical protein